MKGYVRRINSLTNELDELRTKFLVEDKKETFSKGVSAGIIISLNYLAEYFPECYKKWDQSFLDKRVEKFVKRRMPIKNKKGEGG